jgi:hypothetical protein
LETKHDIDTLISLTFHWAKDNETKILQNGFGLTADQQIDAFLAGVKEPNKIRLLKIDQIPFPESPILKNKLDDLGLLNENTIGLTLGHGIYLKSDNCDKRETLVNEFAHVMQYERLGFKEFITQYISECLSFGYPFGHLETEARKIENDICRPKK